MRAWICRIVVIVMVALGLIADVRNAEAQSIEIIEPSGSFLDFGPVNIGAISRIKRIILKNTGAVSPRSVELYIDSPVFTIAASGGDLAPNNTAYWDIVASPVDEYCSGTFSFQYRSPDGDDFATNVFLGCDPRNVPFDADPLSFGLVGPTTITTQRLVVVNTGDTPRAIVAITSSDAAFGVKLRSGHVPLMLAPEDAMELEVRFGPTAALTFHEASFAVTLGDGTSQVITQATGVTSDHVVLRAQGIELNTPVGAPWRRYGRLANYTNHPVMVTGLAIAQPELRVLGVAVGDVVPAHTEIPLLTQLTPAAPGPVSAAFTLSFDTTPPLTEGVAAFGQTALLEFITDDDTPGDGLLDFGTLSPSSPPVTRKITIHNPGSAGIFIDYINFYAGQGFTSPLGSALVAPGASIDVDVTFTPGTPPPVLFEDRRTGGFRITELGTNHYVVGLTAVIPSYTAALSTDELVFPDTVRSPVAPTLLDVTVTNAGMTPMPVPAATITGAAFSLASVPPPATIAPLTSIVYRVAFEPSAVGAFDGVLSLDGSGDVSLHGNGVLRPISAVSEIDFGAVAVGSRARRAIEVHNAGAAPVSLGELIVDGSRFEVIAPAELTIPPGGNVAIEVEYAPTEQEIHAGTLAISLDTDPEPQLRIVLNGTGVSGEDHGCSTSGAPGSLWLTAAVFGMLLRRRRSRKAADPHKTRSSRSID